MIYLNQFKYPNALIPGIAIEGVDDPNCIPCNCAGGAD